MKQEIPGQHLAAKSSWCTPYTRSTWCSGCHVQAPGHQPNPVRRKTARNSAGLMLGEEGKDGEMTVIVGLMSDRLEATASYLFLSPETDHTLWRRLAIGCSKNNRKFLVLSLPRPTYTASSHNHRPLPLYYLLQNSFLHFSNCSQVWVAYRH